jgi:hypothetical protein
MGRTVHLEAADGDAGALVYEISSDVGAVAVYNYAGTGTVFVRTDGGDASALGSGAVRAVPAGARRVMDVDQDGTETAISLLFESDDGIVELEYDGPAGAIQ